MNSDSKPLLMPLFAPQVNSQWVWERLDSIADVFDCPHSTPVLVDDSSSPIVVRSQDVRTGTILLENVAHVSHDTYKERIKRVEPSYGDLVYSREGTYFGIAAEVPKGIRICLGQRMVLIRPDRARINHTYLKYWLNSPQVFGYIHGFRDGTVAERLNLPVIRGLAIAFPPLAMQESIARVLAVLDDRIALLRQTNATLEAIAQALFKSWFVDFDPVRAKQEGREQEGMDAETAALFPDAFQDTELGSIPMGWQPTTLGQICKFNKGCSYKGEGLSESVGANMFNLGCFNAPRIFAFNNVKKYTGEYKERHAVKAGDLIIANTDMTQARDILGRPLLVPNEIEPAFISHHVFKVEVEQKSQQKIVPFLFFLFLQPSFRERAVGYATGTTVLALPKDALDQHVFILPSEEVINRFASLCAPIFARIHENETLGKTLTALRDTLLPRLISGQLRLPEPEEQFSEVHTGT